MDEPAAPHHYLFGDNDRALRRLFVLAEAYEPTSRAFLTRVRTRFAARPEAVLDLGAGPGVTTELLAEIFEPAQLVVYDTSERSVELARARLTRDRLPGRPMVDVVRHEATTAYPHAGLGLVYARHLLAHLAEPDRLIRAALAALAPGGVLAVEETASLDSADDAFTRYYALVTRLQAHYGQRHRVGLELAELADRAGATVLDHRIVETRIPAPVMAGLHTANLRTWADDPFARENFDRQDLAGLQRELDAVRDGDRPGPPVRARIGQVVVTTGRSGERGRTGQEPA
jgi:SAM-dependent methyltransferase